MRREEKQKQLLNILEMWGDDEIRSGTCNITTNFEWKVLKIVTQNHN